MLYPSSPHIFLKHKHKSRIKIQAGGLAKAVQFNWSFGVGFAPQKLLFRFWKASEPSWRLSFFCLSKIKHFISETIHNNFDNLYLEGYIVTVKYELRSTKQYNKWFAKLKDSSIKVRVLARLDRIENGNFGDFKQIGSGLFELRFFFGSGLRIYYTIQDRRVVFLLAGGDKSTQAKDIEKAAQLLSELED